MTVAQWIFHYKEILNEQEKEDKKRKEIIDIIAVSSLFSNASYDVKKASELVQRIVGKDSSESSSFVEEAKKDYEKAPKQITVTLDKKPPEKLGKKKRRGINVSKASELNGAESGS